MTRKRLGLGVIILALLAVVLVLSGKSAADKEPPRVEPVNTPVMNSIPPKDKVIEKVAPVVEEAKPPQTGKMELTPAPQQLADTGPAKVDAFSYSLKNEKKDLQITPGVALQPGKGLKIKIPESQEILHLQRDSTYHPNEYKVLWEKKY